MICVYDIGNTDFETNGNAILQPISGSVKQVAGGSYDIKLVHPIDPDGKWMHLVPGAVVKAPVPEEEIENAFAGYEADVYTTDSDTGMRETATEPQVINYNAWVYGNEYDAGSKVTYENRNYQARVKIENQAVTAAPSDTYAWEEIARVTGGPAIIITLPAGSELYLVEEVDTTWYKMATYYGLEGYVKKSEVTFYKHLSPSETLPRIITEQLFRLREPAIDNENNTVTVTGMHISYDLCGNIIQHVSLAQVSPAFALGRIAEGLMMEYPGTIATNLSGTATYTGEIKGKNGMFALLDPDKGIVPTFGAKFTRDNYDLFVMTKSQVDRGFKIQYGKNVRGINWKKSSSALVTRVVPVAKAEDGSDLYLPEKWVDSSLINDYPVVMMEQLAVKGQVGKDKGTGDGSTWTESDLLDEMRTKAGERFSVDHADQIVQEVTVQFEQLGDTAEYEFMKDLEKVLLYDTVTAQDDRIGLSMQLLVTELEFDIIRKKVTGIKLSNIDSSGSRNVTGYNVQNNSIGSVKLTDEAKQEIAQQALNQVPDLVSTAQGPGNSVNVIDSLTSSSTTDALSANQGKVLKDYVDQWCAWRYNLSLGANTLISVTHAEFVLVASDRGGLWTDGVSGLDLTKVSGSSSLSVYRSTDSNTMLYIASWIGAATTVSVFSGGSVTYSGVTGFKGEYDDSSTYAVNDIVWHNGALYKCTTAIATAEAWDADHWTKIAE